MLPSLAKVDSYGQVWVECHKRRQHSFQFDVPAPFPGQKGLWVTESAPLCKTRMRFLLAEYVA